MSMRFLILFVVLAAAVGAGLAQQFAFPASGGAFYERPGAAALIGAACALVLTLTTRLVRLVLGRRERRARHRA